MKRIGIERYHPIPGENTDNLSQVTDWCSGLIEGERDDGTTWIMFLDNHGSPQCFWANRDETGAVIGDSIDLTKGG